MPQAIDVVWFKRDLRLSDHAPLAQAADSPLPCLLIYNFEPILLDDPHYSHRHWRFVYQSLCDLNAQLKKHIRDCYEKIQPRGNDEHIFISQKGSVYSIQRINVILKDLRAKYNLKIKNFSSHSLRKCFGRDFCICYDSS